MIVMKFGGTSVENSSAIRRLIEIVKQGSHQKRLVVVSACSGVTNDLIRAANTVYSGDKEKALNILDKLRVRHRTIAEELLGNHGRVIVFETIDEIFQELRNIVRGVHLLGELTKKSLDTFTSYGERLSSLIIQAAIAESDIPSALVDARTVMITDNSFSEAKPIISLIEERAKSNLLPLLDEEKIVITQGFIGSSRDGATTTIGRGGSDYSAAIFGSVLCADEIQIWTDVDGMMTADPRIVPDAKLIDEMSFDEASELAYFGAKVLHPNTILPAMQKNIPVRILNSKRPQIKGTLIINKTINERKDVVKSVASKKGIIVVNVSSSRMLLAHGFLAKLFSIFAEHGKSVDVVATSEVSVSLTIDVDTGFEEIRKELETIGEVGVQTQRGIICIVGEGMKQTPGIAARIFGALAGKGINIEMISEGASEINLTIVVKECDVDNSVRILHDEFFSNEFGIKQ
ncbi:MAG: lysine-sensitive aspartokinase 3 [Ignavibacteriales bacterium]|nr:lysine-sensitive aspartokinase 3 [Ignavibacteriales bacterium]